MLAAFLLVLVVVVVVAVNKVQLDQEVVAVVAAAV
jgi:hypothetical protein